MANRNHGGERIDRLERMMERLLELHQHNERRWGQDEARWQQNEARWQRNEVRWQQLAKYLRTSEERARKQGDRIDAILKILYRKMEMQR